MEGVKKANSTDRKGKRGKRKSSEASTTGHCTVVSLSSSSEHRQTQKQSKQPIPDETTDHLTMPITAAAGNDQDTTTDLLRCCLHRRRRRHPQLILGPVPLLRQFSYKDLKRATDEFRRPIASHSNGVTYEAKLEDGSVALVKEIKGAEQRQDDFYREVQLLGCLHHRHLVALRGYSSGRQSFLVFESTGYGSLKEHLNDPLKTPLNWKTRLNIAIAIASALEYLELFCEPPIYYASINSSSILLDERFCAKLSDICLVDSAIYHAQLPNSSGTDGKLPLLSFAECKDLGSWKLIPQFGGLILELITGQSSEKGSAEVIRWVQESDLGTSMHNMIDPDLGDSYDGEVLRNLLALARLCIKANTSKPSFSISHVLRYLQQKAGLLHDRRR
ncbi:putative receptor-like protein [Drosera capensis]